MNFLSFIMRNTSYFAMRCLYQAASCLLSFSSNPECQNSFCGRQVKTFMISETFVNAVQGPCLGTLHFESSTLAIYVVSIL